jgi:hypothetical protein
MLRTDRPASLALALAGLLGACGADPARTSSSAGPGPAGPSAEHPDDHAAEGVTEEGDLAGASRGELEAAGAPVAEETTGSTESRVPSEVAVTRPLLSLSYARDLEAEDGAGGRSLAPLAVAFDLDARRVPARALDPVLHVGARLLRRYEHPRVGVLRFVLAEGALPPDGVEVFVQYGDDETTRLPLGALSRASIAEAR